MPKTAQLTSRKKPMETPISFGLMLKPNSLSGVVTSTTIQSFRTEEGKS